MSRTGNTAKQGTNLQNKKMFNNFLDSLDISAANNNGPQVNTSVQLNTGFHQPRTKSGTQHGSKLQREQA